MDATFLFRGIGLGFAIAAAVGPISLLTIRRTIAHGQTYGLASGLGVALADGTYAGIAAFGLTAITTVLVGGRAILGIVGGAFLILLGFRTIASRPGAAPRAETTDRPGLAAAFASIFGLTLTNPMTILSFAALFVGLGVTGGDAAGATLLTLGVFAGSAAWWVVLVTVVGAVRSRLTPTGMRRINIASGALIGAFALVALATALLG